MKLTHSRLKFNPPTQFAEGNLLMVAAPSANDKSIVGLTALTLLGVNSAHTKRAYGSKLAGFLASGCPLTRQGVQGYLGDLAIRGASPSSQKMALAAIKALVRESYFAGVLVDQDRHAIDNISSPKQRGSRVGNWLDGSQIRRMMETATKIDRGPIGVRNAAMIALMAGCGLRREELVNLTCGQYDWRDGRRVLADFKGKGGRVRTVAVPDWAVQYINDWVSKNNWSNGEFLFDLSTQTVYDVVRRVMRAAGFTNIAPHDLRRSCAKLCLQGGAEITQIQGMLGHSSVATTERYLGNGIQLGSGKAANDFMQM